METCSVARRLFALTLVATLWLIGLPSPASATGEEDAAGARHRGLTFNGRPLSEFAALPAPSRSSPPRRRRVSGEQFLGGTPVMESFDTLATVLQPGYEVVVEDESGQRRRGRVSSISHDGLTLAACPWNSSCGASRGLSYSGEYAYTRTLVTRVEIVDSTWNGALIGAAISPALVYGLHRWELGVSGNPDAIGVFLLAPGIVLVSMGVGAAIDLSINESIYERPSQAPRVTIAPLIGRHQKGLAVRVGF